MLNTISTLSTKYKNEDVHSLFVAKTAIILFNAVRGHFNLSTSLKPLLSAAAMLHDIQYAAEPYNHAAQSASLVLSKKLDSFTKTQRAIIAATIALHKKDYSIALHSPLFKDPVVEKTALMLGAILRIADGLDHGHVQNCTILSIKKTSYGILCLCKSPGYHGNCSWAQAKADLWKQVFKCNFTVIEKPDKKNVLKYEGIVHKNDTVIEAFRRLMYLNYRIYTENIPGMLLGKSSEPLHDARIALRRMRSLIIVFKPFLNSPRCTFLANRLASLALQLSQKRDNDVWAELLLNLKKDPAFSKDKNFTPFYSKQIAAKDTSLKAVLSNKSHSLFLRTLNRFIRIELSQLIKTKHPLSLKSFAEQKLVSVYTRVLAKPFVKKEYDVDKMHSLRKLCRRGRYYAEFFAPALDEKDAKFCKLFKAMADALGDLHDADVALAKLRTNKSSVAKKISAWLIDVKETYYAAYRKSFSALCSPSVVSRVTQLQTQRNLQHPTLFFFCDSLVKANIKKGKSNVENAVLAIPFLAGCSSTIAGNIPAISLKKELEMKATWGSKIKIVQKKCLCADASFKDLISYSNQILRSEKGYCFIGYWPLFLKVLEYYISLTQSQKTSLEKAKAFCLSFPLPSSGNSVQLEWFYSRKLLSRIASRVTS